MKNFITFLALTLLVIVLAIVLFDFRITESGRVPDVEVSGGRLPKAEVRGPDVEVQTTEKEIAVPEVDVGTKDVTVEMPTGIDVDVPEESDYERPMEQ